MDERVQDAMEKLKQQRDELRLKMHLAKAGPRETRPTTCPATSVRPSEC
jgi:hypothetical protein